MSRRVNKILYTARPCRLSTAKGRRSFLVSHISHSRSEQRHQERARQRNIETDLSTSNIITMTPLRVTLALDTTPTSCAPQLQGLQYVQRILTHGWLHRSCRQLHVLLKTCCVGLCMPTNETKIPNAMRQGNLASRKPTQPSVSPDSTPTSPVISVACTMDSDTRVVHKFVEFMNLV